RSSVALGPPILVGTQPGSTALLSTCGQARARVSASAVTWSLLSPYACMAFQRRSVQSMSRRDPAATRCSPLVRDMSRSGRSISAVSRGGARGLTAGGFAWAAGGGGVDGGGLCVAVGGGGAGRLEVDAGVVDDRVHPADVVHPSGERPGLGCAGQVADDDSRCARGEASD